MDAAFSSTPDDGLNVTSRSGGMGRKGINVADYGLDTEQQTRGLGNTDIPANTTDASTFGTGGDFAYAGAGGTDYGARTGNGTRDEDELEYNAGSNASKPGMGDKIRGKWFIRCTLDEAKYVWATGNLEQVAGKVSRNPGMQERGQDRKVCLILYRPQAC